MPASTRLDASGSEAPWVSGAVDEALARVGRKREVAIVVPRFSIVPFLLEEVAALATMPELIPVAERPVSLLWRRKDRDDPRQRWLRALIRGAVQESLSTSIRSNPPL